MPLWYVYTVAGVFGFLMMIPLAGVPSLLPLLVSRGDLNAAVAIGPDVAGAVIALALYGAFSVPLTISGQTLRVKIIPPGYHGRCFAIMRTLMQSGGPLGGVSAGFAVPVIGVRGALTGIALITCGLGLTIPALRRALIGPHFKASTQDAVIRPIIVLEIGMKPSAALGPSWALCHRSLLVERTAEARTKPAFRGWQFEPI